MTTVALRLLSARAAASSCRWAALSPCTPLRPVATRRWLSDGPKPPGTPAPAEADATTPPAEEPPTEEKAEEIDPILQSQAHASREAVMRDPTMVGGKEANKKPIHIDTSPEVPSQYLASGALVHDVLIGTGGKVNWDDQFAIHYSAMLVDTLGVLDTTWRPGEPHEAYLGDGFLGPALEEAIEGMREGGRRVVIVGGAMTHGKFIIPDDRYVVYEIDLVRVKRPESLFRKLRWIFFG